MSQFNGITDKIHAWQTSLNNDPHFWLFHPHHQAENEFEIRDQENTYRVDRTFICNEKRWIIDIKTEWQEHPEKNIDKLHHKHQKQLNRYAHLFKQFESRKILCALYFPLMGFAISWEPPTEPAMMLTRHHQVDHYEI